MNKSEWTEVKISELDTLREENERLKIVNGAYDLAQEEIHRVNLRNQELSISKEELRAWGVRQELRAETAEAKLEDWYLTHKIGYCGKHEYQHLREDAGCPECLLETAEARVKELEEELELFKVDYETDGVWDRYDQIRTFCNVQDREMQELKAKLSRYESAVKINAIVYANGREAHFWLPENAEYRHMDTVKLLLLPEEDV